MLRMKVPCVDSAKKRFVFGEEHSGVWKLSVRCCLVGREICKIIIAIVDQRLWVLNMEIRSGTPLLSFVHKY
jgi:hypothetical protein